MFFYNICGLHTTNFVIFPIYVKKSNFILPHIIFVGIEDSENKD
jgi:hypothetical protein